MLKAELKTTDEVQLSKPLMEYVKKNYPSATYKDPDVANGIKLVSQLRSDVKKATQKTATTYDLLSRYYGYLSLLESRFPINDCKIKLTFKWTDSFNKKKSCSQKSLAIEKASVLYNMGIVKSALGDAESLGNDEGCKAACQHYQAAAGIFGFLRDFVSSRVVGENPTADLTPQALELLYTVAMGKAQVCFVEKAELGGMKSAIVAKLAQQAAEYFRQGLGHLGTATLSSVVDKSAAGKLQAYQMAYEALADWHLSKTYGEKSTYGMELALLQRSMYKISHARGHSGDTPQFDDKITRLHGLVQSKLAQAQKDNDTIYLDMVPKPEQVPKIEGKAMVKPLPFSQTTLPSDDPFHKLAPLSALKAAAEYQEKVSALLAEHKKAATGATKAAEDALEQFGLANFKAMYMSTGNALPEQLKENFKAVQAQGGAAHLYELMDQLNAVSTENKNYQDKVDACLKKEEETDVAMSVQHGPKWNRQPSRQLNAELHETLTKLRHHYGQAVSSDDFIRNQMRNKHDSISKAAMNIDEVEASLPAIGALEGTEGNMVQRIGQLLDRLEAIIQNRQKEVDQMNSTIQEDNVLPTLVQNAGNEPEERTIANELAKYKTYEESLAAGVADQEKVLAALTEENTRFQAVKKGGQLEKEREAALNTLRQTVVDYKEVDTNIKEGLKFHTEFQSRIRNLLQQAEDYAMARQHEMDILIQSIQQVTVSSSGNRPPTAPAAAAPPQYGGGYAVMASQPFSAPPAYAYGAPPAQGGYAPPPGGYAQQMPPPGSYGAPLQPPPGYAPPPGYRPDTR